MKVLVEVKEVEGNNAYCRDCFADNLPIMSYEEAIEKSKLPKGKRACKITISRKSGGTIYLCLLHAECLAEDIMKKLP